LIGLQCMDKGQVKLVHTTPVFFIIDDLL
jgi:hypothetical protein